MIKADDIYVKYPDGFTALRGVSFSLKEGESLAVIGANGAGKSTLLRAIVGLSPIYSGSITVNGIEVVKKNLPLIRKMAGMIFQNPDDQLFQVKVLDDIQYGLRREGLPEEEIRKRTEEAADQLGMQHLLNKLTHKLSGGEKRLTAIAGILVMKPSLLLMDEPASFLDPRAKRNFMHTIADIPLTKILVTHDFSLAQALCERVILLQNGKIAAWGMTKEILQDEELLLKSGL